MEVREMIGTSIRTMVKTKVTTSGDQHQGMVNVAAEIWERGGQCGYNLHCNVK